MNGQIGDLKTDMAKIGINVNVTSDSTRSNIDLKNPGSFDKGAIPYFFVTSKEAGSSTSASGFFGKTVGVVIKGSGRCSGCWGVRRVFLLAVGLVPGRAGLWRGLAVCRVPIPFLSPGVIARRSGP